jgi:hypothetical protein
MSKVIVERPRKGSRMRGEGKGYWRALKRVKLDELPRREGIKAFRAGKYLNEHLGPLRRYLRKQVGRPWDKVFAEICAHISRANAVQDHVRDHVFDYVAVYVQEIDGVLHETTRWGRPIPLADSWRGQQMYLCPRTGILKLIKGKSRRARKQARELPQLQVAIDHKISFIRQAGVWYRVEFAAFPTTIVTGFHAVTPTVEDALQGTYLTRAAAVHHYGRPIIAKKARIASREEARRFCEPLKAPNVVR